jgi:hypothetical protein
VRIQHVRNQADEHGLNNYESRACKDLPKVFHGKVLPDHIDVMQASRRQSKTLARSSTARSAGKMPALHYIISRR